MKKADTWMPLYIGDYLADTSRLTTEQHGAFLLILMDYWRNGAPPDDETVLASISKLSVQQWRKHAPTLRPFFRIEDNLWRNERADRERENAGNVSSKRSESGKAGAVKRWGKQDGEGNGDQMAIDMANAMANAMANPSQNDAPSPSPSEHLSSIAVPAGVPKSKNRTGTAGATLLPDEWRPKPSDVSKLAVEFGLPGSTIAGPYVDGFRDACQAKGYRYRDFDAAFRNCVRQDWPRLRVGQKPNAPTDPFAGFQ